MSFGFQFVAVLCSAFLKSYNVIFVVFPLENLILNVRFKSGFVIDSTIHDHNRKALVLVPPDFRSCVRLASSLCLQARLLVRLSCVWLICPACHTVSYMVWLGAVLTKQHYVTSIWYYVRWFGCTDRLP